MPDIVAEPSDSKACRSGDGACALVDGVSSDGGVKPVSRVTPKPVSRVTFLAEKPVSRVTQDVSY